MTAKDEALERLVNLTFALLDASARGTRPLSAQWLYEHVQGYSGRSRTACQKMLQRDIAVLRVAGVPIEICALPDSPGLTAYRITEDEYSLPPVQFTPEEATVLALAGDMGLSKQLSAFARSGWTKLAASGAARDRGAAPAVRMFNDTAHLRPQMFDTILNACRNQQRLTFVYTPSPTATGEHRTMDPWGLVTHQGRIYLVGFDVDRNDVRCFRILRVSNVERTGTSLHPRPDDTQLRQHVITALRRGKTLVDIRFSAADGTVTELTSRATRVGAHYELHEADREWVVRTAAAEAPDIIITEPADVVADVIQLLQTGVEHNEEDPQ